MSYPGITAIAGTVGEKFKAHDTGGYNPVSQYIVINRGKPIFTGTAAEISEKYKINTGSVYSGASSGNRVGQKYYIQREKHEAKRD